VKTARDVMTPNPDFVRAGATICEAACKMKTLDVGALPVCDDAGNFVGMVTDRDITLRATAEGRDPNQTCVGDVMTGDLVYCTEDTPADEVARVMQRHQIRRVPIVQPGQSGEVPPHDLRGIVSLGDLATDLPVEPQDVPGRTLEKVSEQR
jgi:CBS domain-containing protein